MELYSWFLRIDKNPNVKKVNVSNDLLQTSKSVKYIENYTMWPTAKIKPNVAIILPSYDDKLDKSKAVILSSKSRLSVIKN